jgi:hypothetical protein
MLASRSLLLVAAARRATAATAATATTAATAATRLMSSNAASMSPLKKRIAELIPQKAAEIKDVKAKLGDKILGECT